MHIHKCLYLSEENLRDRMAIRDLVHNFPTGEKIILLHEAFSGTIPDTRFVTKRLSALFSEQMVYNNAFSADQRDLICQGETGLSLNKTLIEKLFTHIQLLILNPIVSSDAGPVLADSQKIASRLRSEFAIEQMVLFPANPLSPLATKHPSIHTEEDLAYWKPLYEEEEQTLVRAFQLAPAQIVSPSTYGS